MSSATAINAQVRAGLTPAAIRALHRGLAPSTVKGYIREARRAMSPAERETALACRPAITPSPGRFDDREPLSPTHRRVGIRLAQYRDACRLSATAFAERHGLNRIRVVAIERGIVELPLSELEQLAGILGIDVPDLLTPLTAPQPAFIPRTGRLAGYDAW